MLFVSILVIIVWLVLVGEYLLVSGVTNSVILLLVAYLQLLNSRIVYDSFIQVKTCHERFSTSIRNWTRRGSMTNFAQYLFSASIPYIILTVFFVITYLVFSLNAYFLAASAKYEWERYQRYKRIREVREQRNLEPVIVQNENEWDWKTNRLY